VEADGAYPAVAYRLRLTAITQTVSSLAFAPTARAKLGLVVAQAASLIPQAVALSMSLRLSSMPKPGASLG